MNSCIPCTTNIYHLASGQGSISNLAADGTNVYWTVNLPSGSLGSIPRVGGATSALWSGPHASALAAHGGFVYWIDPSPTGAVWRLDTSTGVAAIIESNQNAPQALAVGAGGVYWSDFAKNIYVADFNGGPPWTVTTALSLPVAIAVDSMDVFWLGALNGAGVIGRVPTSGGIANDNFPSTTLSSNPNLAARSASAFWADGFGVSSAPPGLVDSGGSNNSVQVALDAANVYWVGANSVWIASGNSSTGGYSFVGTPTSIAVDADCIYWATTSGDVYKAAKGPTCKDGVLNGSESDVDCGGDKCPGCKVGKACTFSNDCAPDACSSQGACSAGFCVHGPPLDCSGLDSTCGKGVCDPKIGCTFMPLLADGTACDDKVACTVNDQCKGRACVGTDQCPCHSVPEVIAVDPSGAGAIVVDATHAYWASGVGAIARAPLAGGSSTTLWTGMNPPQGLTVAAGSLYWSPWPGASTILSMPVAGGSPTTLQQTTANDVAVDAMSIYWVDSAGGQVLQAPLGGGAPIVLAQNQKGRGSIAVDATHVYWTNVGDGSVASAQIGGGGLAYLAGGLGQPTSIAVDANNVYWADPGGGTIDTVPKGGGARTTRPAGVKPDVVLVDATNMYWIDGFGGGLYKAPLAGGLMTDYHPSGGAQAFTIDGSCLYYVDGSGSITKVTK